MLKRKYALISGLSIIFIVSLIFSLSALIENNLIQKSIDQTFGENTYKFIIFTAILPLFFYIALAIVLLFLWYSILDNFLSDNISQTTLNTLKIIGRLIIIPFTIIAYLNGFEEFQGTLLGATALFGTAVGFASTTTLSNLFSGVYLMLMRPFAIGDYIILDGSSEGCVEEITVNYTKIKLRTGNTVLYSNRSLLNKPIINTAIKKIEKINGKEQQVVRCYQYGITWGVPLADEHQRSVNIIKKSIKDLEKAGYKFEEPVTWFIKSRDRLERIYQINIVVKDAYDLLTLPGEFLTFLAENFEKDKEQGGDSN